MYTRSVSISSFTYRSGELPAPVNARERSRVETRRRLLHEGQRLFALQGVGKTRTADIARAAGVAVGTLYLHFSDKRGLLRAILFEGIEELLEPLHALAAAPPATPSEAVSLHTRIMVEFAAKRRDFCRVLFDPESVQLEVSPEIIAYLVSMHEQRLRESIARGLLSESIHPAVTAHAVVGMLVKVLDWWTSNPGTLTQEELIENLTRLRVSGISPD
jgi:AcrR family transcriptional regulator